jgi:methylglutaconyl-CoA hydratase
MKPRTLEIEIETGVGRIWLNRPEVHNAFDEIAIAELADAVAQLETDPAVRVLVLAGRGRSFCAGADLNWMKRAASYTEEENLRDALSLAEMLRRIDQCAKPTVARVQGAAFGGGVGLVSVCDIAIAAEPAVFATTEVLYGLIPATIGPYVIAAIGARAARRYFLTAERFGADEARRIGLVHEVCAIENLDTRISAVVRSLLDGGPAAQAEAKAFIRRMRGAADTETIAHTAQCIARLRTNAEAKEGIGAFLEKRKPSWRP